MKKNAIAFIVVLLSVGCVFAQNSDLPPIDESQFTDSAAGTQPAAPQPAVARPVVSQPPAGKQAQPEIGPEPQFETSSSSDETGFQNAVIEGVQLSSEPGDVADEKVVSGYFIFRDKPSSFFYDVRVKEKKVVFEFNDTKTGTAPISSPTEPPITGFTVEQKKIDINKDVRGLKPEWHNQVRIIFKVNKMPKITVNDEYNVISFSYKWTADPNKEKRYEEGNGPNYALWSSVALGTIGAAGAIAYLVTPSHSTAQGAIQPDPLPLHRF